MSDSHPSPDQLPSVDDDQPGGVIRVGPERRLEALQKLMGGGGSSRVNAERFVEFSEANAVRIDSMWARLGQAGTIDSTVLAVPNPGRTAVVFATSVAGPADVEHRADTIRAACDDLGRTDVDLLQVLLDPSDTALRDAFRAAGFTVLARLTYMERPLPGPGQVPKPLWPDGVTVEPFAQTRRDDLLAVLDATYEDTLDCPGLRGLRRTEDILAGHLGTGEFDPALWTLLSVDGIPCGALLLSRSPASQTVELVYLGLARSARGRGLGRELLRHGLNLLAGERGRRVTLAVDERNEPAIALYETEGFRRVLRRLAMIRPM